MDTSKREPLLHLGIPLKQEDYERLGQITAMFGYIEMYVDMTMMHLLSIKNFGTFDTVMAGKNSGSKVSLLLQLANGISTKDAALGPALSPL